MFEHLRVPAFCPICEHLMKGKSTSTFYDWGCCINCFIEFIADSNTRVERWKNGWRPSKEEVEAYLRSLDPSI